MINHEAEYNDSTAYDMFVRHLSEQTDVENKHQETGWGMQCFKEMDITKESDS